MTPDQAAQILGVSINISKDELKTKFRKLAMIHHPDKSDAPHTADKFMLIKEAYDLLKDYDQNPQIIAGDIFGWAESEPYGVYTVNGTSSNFTFTFNA